METGLADGGRRERKREGEGGRVKLRNVFGGSGIY